MMVTMIHFKQTMMNVKTAMPPDTIAKLVQVCSCYEH
jgi:hypothetical protein